MARHVTVDDLREPPPPPPPGLPKNVQSNLKHPAPPPPPPPPGCQHDHPMSIIPHTSNGVLLHRALDVVVPKERERERMGGRDEGRDEGIY